MRPEGMSARGPPSQESPARETGGTTVALESESKQGPQCDLVVLGVCPKLGIVRSDTKSLHFQLRLRWPVLCLARQPQRSD
jgi:hypothetical protein